MNDRPKLKYYIDGKNIIDSILRSKGIEGVLTEYDAKVVSFPLPDSYKRERATFTIVVGLPGSGKTTWATGYCRKNNVVLIDDPKESIVDLVNQFDKVMLCDPNLCFYRNFQAAKGLFPEAKWVFFEPSSEICWKNVEKRKSKEPWRKISKVFFDRLSQTYSDNFNKMLDQVKVVEVLKCFNSLEKIGI